MGIKTDEHEPHAIHDLIVDIPGGSTGASGRVGEPLQHTLAQNPGKHEPDRSTSDA